MHSCHFGDMLVTGDPWWLRPIGQLFASTGVVVVSCCAAWVVPGGAAFDVSDPGGALRLRCPAPETTPPNDSRSL